MYEPSDTPAHRIMHGYKIHSLSPNNDGATFIAADDLTINLWDLTRTDECYTIVSLKPSDGMEVSVNLTLSVCQFII